MAGKKWSYKELENMTYEEYRNIFFEDIPSGNESEDDQSGSDEDFVDVDVHNATNTNNNVGIHPERVSDSDSSYSDDDLIPLADLQKKLSLDKFVWKKVATNYTAPQEFTKDSGPCNILDDIERPVEVFLCLFPDSLFDHIVFQTNLYATQASARSGKLFTPTNTMEMKKFVAINILMGIKRLPSYRDFWSTQIELRDKYISSLIPRTRFDWLLGNVHLNDSVMQPKRGEPLYDKLYKVRPILQILSENYAKYYKPTKNVSIDESMIRFKGRSSLRQYMPNKPIKRGYKVLVRASESGYVDHFQIYTGKNGENAEKNLGARVVTDLTRSLVNGHHIVYFDNYFTSLMLLRQLKLDKIYACGTIRQNRVGIPTDVKEDKASKRGESDFRVTDDGITFCKWKDKRVVAMASNFHMPGIIETVERKKKDGERETIACPVIIKNYNANMGYVDKADILKSTYELDRKSRKWWHRIMWHFVDVTIVNAYILYTERCKEKSLDLKSFRLSVATGLVGAASKNPRRGRPSTEMPPNKFKANIPLEKRTDQAAHMPKHSSSRRCAFCSTKAEQHRTRWSCSTCNVGLCLTDQKNCFEKYHSK
ncbi:unnamed protein product [Acanthoscelides obtectus]|uniref:PiggyBac transposable element-derived protein domain-containing protein n=1 Tax=Acanthoscelides obtectus TaxID=200917 RepID=A0A9P0P8F4_ACAOB|nr:unnamed protein product [Acanthoscelides obtectus]CAK1627667.1 PiggyBac transposable element-derived protein 4 [Acanthoscelides obtectus]